jgi:threonine synthase
MHYSYSCTDCGATYQAEEVRYLCPACSKGLTTGQPLKGILSVELPYNELKKALDPTTASPRDLMPVVTECIPPLMTEMTPLSDVVLLSRATNCSRLFLKNDTLLPTGSFKDRASSVVVAKAIEIGEERVITASTGNAATALAGMCASSGIASTIIVPATAPKAKLAQMMMFGADVVPIDGSYDDAFDLSLALSDKYGWYNRNTGYNPFTIEGKKSAALEIFFQLGKVPHKIIIPTGDGVILAGIYKGFYDLMQLGWTDRMPQLIPVQAEGSAAINTALASEQDSVTPLTQAITIADSINVAAPRAGNRALACTRKTNGFGITVSDTEIMKASHILAKTTGIFAEPAAAASIAGVIKGTEERLFDPHDIIVALVTGTGLKDIPAAEKIIPIPKKVQASLDAVSKALGV